jgi:tetratricopeptide (TPR) repeat protein
MWRWISRRRREGAELQYQRGASLQASGDAHGAERHFRAALELDPRHVDAQIDLGVTLLAQGLPTAAERACRRALEMAPGALAAHINLGSTLERQGRLPEAVDAWKKALAIAPDSAHALCNLSAVQLRFGALEEAARLADHAVRAAPAFAEAHLRRGKAWLELGRAEDAANSLREATRLNPRHAQLWNALGYALDVQGKLDDALRCYDQALALRPEDVQGHVNRAGMWLARGEFAKGWDEFAWRERAPENAPVHARFELPRWDGSPLGGRSLLVYAEQGLGDQIMYASCLPEVIAQAGACSLECDARLATLFKRSFPGARVHGGSQSDNPEWLAAGTPELAVSIGNLPRFLRRSAADFPRTAYLRADHGRVAAWRERLAQLGPGRKIGLSWRGGVPQTGRAWRSIPIERLAPLLEAPGCNFISLQYGDAEPHPKIRHWPEALADYDETAALVGALDLTVTVCTAVVHLAGALGRPAWVMAPVRPESRYGLAGESMPWYDSVRMFRQETFGDWNPVIARVAAELRRG